MNTPEKTDTTLFQTLKENSTNLLTTANTFLANAVTIFKKDESTMTVEEKIEKQHMLNFIYGAGAGIVLYHFFIGAILLLVIIWLYGLSLKKTQGLVEEVKPKKRTYKRRKRTAADKTTVTSK